MTHKNKDKILPVRYNPGRNGNYSWELGNLIWDKEAPTNKPYTETKRFERLKAEYLKNDDLFTGKKRGPKPKQI